VSNFKYQAEKSGVGLGGTFAESLFTIFCLPFVGVAAAFHPKAKQTLERMQEKPEPEQPND
jgi:predicted esterase YcpF (UPF0227 family)